MTKTTNRSHSAKNTYPTTFGELEKYSLNELEYVFLLQENTAKELTGLTITQLFTEFPNSKHLNSKLYGNTATAKLIRLLQTISATQRAIAVKKSAIAASHTNE